MRMWVKASRDAAFAATISFFFFEPGKIRFSLPPLSSQVVVVAPSGRAPLLEQEKLSKKP